MKRILFPFLGLSLIGMWMTGCKSSQVPTKEKSIVILYDNDVHCAIENYSKIAGLRDAIADTALVALVSSGDYLQGGTAGAISTGQYVIDVMKEAGYDAVTLGNHEFDYKMPRMMELLSMLGVPVTCVNLRDSKTLKPLFQPYVMKQMGNKKVAFVGATTPTARNTEEYAFVDEKYNELYNLSPDSLSALVQNAVNSSRAAGADYVVLLTHLGEDKNEFDSDSHYIIHHTHGVNAVLDGHTHSVIASDTVHDMNGKPVVISQTGTKLMNVGKLVIRPNGKITTEMVPTSEIKQENAKVKKAYDIVDAQSRSFTNMVIGNNETLQLVQDDNAVKIIRMQETNAGDLAADAIMDYSNTDITMINAGAIRANLPAGEINFGKIMDFTPYDNQLYFVEETGAKITELLTACIQTLPEDDGDFPQVAGLKFDVDAARHTVSNVQVLNKAKNQFEPIVADKLYTIGTLDYTVTGGGFRGILRNSKILKKDDKTMSILLSEYIKKTLKGNVGKEYSRPKGRITIKY